MKDRVGNTIPKRLEAVFNRPGLFTMMEKQQEIASDVLSRIDSGDELFSGIRRATIEAAFIDIQNLLKAEVPHAVCDWCYGEGCKACKDKGWVGRFVWDITPRRA